MSNQHSKFAGPAQVSVVVSGSPVHCCFHAPFAGIGMSPFCLQFTPKF